MLDTLSPVIPPAPAVHAKDLPPVKLLLGSIRNNLAIWSDNAFDTGFNRNTLFGVESVLVNDPAGVRHMMATNAANYVRPAMTPRILRPMVGHGVFLAEGGEWRRQRRLLSPSFTPNHVNILLPHFIAAANDLVGELEGQSSADLSDAYQIAALNAVLRALFSMPDRAERDRIGDLVRRYVTGPGRPQIFDAFAKSENSFAFALGKRRAFQKRWFSAVDAIVSARRDATRDTAHHDLLDLLIAVRDPETGASLAADEVRDQCATMIFAGYETTARLLFWASYLLTLDQAEQTRLRAEVAAFPPERVATLDDLGHWPRLRRVLLETMRLYPPVPVLVREPIEDDVIMGEPVRRGVQVYVAPWVLHRHRKHWQHPTAFMPDRFAGQASPWTSGGAYLPFGAGPRICIGAGFALAEAQIMLATVLQRYTLAIGSQRPVMPVARLTIQPSYAPMFKLERTLSP
ncbi:cytochrome P450 [Bradyrhizobium sp. S69]|uniref:cytochrome P450 n=1 Tax=Bradyrhizobium sp. S69 TaxID=1641856 RepID=UPI00131B9A6B|nr:cytochrome P450 [Bradyrhizobium sp. S69]